MKHPSLIKRQQGVTLLISLIMLVVLTLFVLAMVNTSIVNLRIVGNQQFRVEGRSAAQLGIEYMISKNFTSPLPTGPTEVLIDINGDGANDYKAVVAVPQCINARAIKLAELDINNTLDKPCFTSGASQQSGLLPGGATGGNSLCSNTQWELTSSVDDTGFSSAKVIIHQGVGIRVGLGTNCP